MKQVAEPAQITFATPAQVPHTQVVPCWWKLAITAGILGLLYYQVLGKLAYDWWTDPNFSHGFFVPLFAGYLLWEDRERLATIPLRPSWMGLPVVIFGLGALFGGVFGAELFLQRFSLMMIAAGLVIYFLGWKWMREVLFPWAVLWLMIPIPAIVFNRITFPLQLLASQLATAILQLLNVPVLREGNVINLSVMPLEVAEACSGIRSLLSLGTLSVIYGYFLERRVWARWTLLIASVPIAVGANALRVVVTGLLVQYVNPEMAQGFFHEFSGWVIFLFALLLLLGVHGIIRMMGRKSSPLAEAS